LERIWTIVVPTPLQKSNPKTLSELQTAMDEFVSGCGWYETGSVKPQSPQNLAASISIEANELLECFQWGDDAEPDRAAEELADVVLYAAQLANVLGIDLGRALDEKLTLNHRRFPTDERWQRSLAS
jgi:NTP pyrophosphatase (non-canonical NTP hydrolase)